MSRLVTSVVVLALFAGTAGSVGCASGGSGSQPVQTATAEDGVFISQEIADRLVEGKTTATEVKRILGAEPQGTTEVEGGTQWVYAWSRATADEHGNVVALEARTLLVLIEDGVVQKVAYGVSDK